MAAITSTIYSGTSTTPLGTSRTITLVRTTGLYGSRTSVTTYYYRTSAGASGSTTVVGSIPAGATVERTRTA